MDGFVQSVGMYGRGMLWDVIIVISLKSIQVVCQQRNEGNVMKCTYYYHVPEDTGGNYGYVQF